MFSLSPQDAKDFQIQDIKRDIDEIKATLETVDVNPVPDLSVPAAIIAMLREAKEKHAPVMFINNDETRAVLVKDANDLNLKITVNGVPFEEI